VLRHLNRISYLEMKLKNAEDKEAELNANAQAEEKVKNQLLEQIELCSLERIQTIEKMNQWRERAMMQMEDSEMHLTRQNFLLFSIKKLRELNKGLT
jgi:hypothetical protein